MVDNQDQTSKAPVNRRAILRTAGGIVGGGALAASTASASRPEIDLNIYQTARLTFGSGSYRNRFEFAEALKGVFEQVVPYQEAGTDVTVVETPVNASHIDFSDSPSLPTSAIRDAGPTADDSNVLLTTEGSGRAGDSYAWAPARRDDSITLSGSILDFDPVFDSRVGHWNSDKYYFPYTTLHEVGHTLVDPWGINYDGDVADPPCDGGYDHMVGWRGDVNDEFVHTIMAKDQSCYESGNFCTNTVGSSGDRADYYLKYSDCFWDQLNVD